MLTFDALEDFLQVRPNFSATGRQDDLVQSPMRFPTTQEAVNVYVRKLDGGRFMVHDNGAAVRQVRDFDTLQESVVWDVFRTEWIERGVTLDEEGRLLTFAADAVQLPGAVARLMEAQLVLATLALARRAAGGEAL